MGDMTDDTLAADARSVKHWSGWEGRWRRDARSEQAGVVDRLRLGDHLGLIIAEAVRS